MQIQTNGLIEVTILKTVRPQFEVSNEKPRKLFFKNQNLKRLQLQVTGADQ